MDGHVQLSGATLDEVNVMLEAGAQLTIANSQLYRVSFESAGEPGTATVQISHSELRSSLLRVQKVELVSTFLDVSVVEADELSAVDLEAREAILSSRLATISASRLRTTRVNECETLLIAHSEVNNSHVEACARATRLYEVEAIGATFDGELESDLSSFIEGRFGVRDATTLLSWNSTLNNVALCAGTNQVRFSSGALYCVTCAGPLDARAADLCLGSGSTSMDSNTCRALDQPPICSPFPARQRPFSGT